MLMIIMTTVLTITNYLHIMDNIVFHAKQIELTVLNMKYYFLLELKCKY